MRLKHAATKRQTEVFFWTLLTSMVHGALLHVWSGILKLSDSLLVLEKLMETHHLQRYFE